MSGGRINAIEEYIFNLPKFTGKTTPDNVRRHLALMGDPQNGFKIVHVAGTNGKGSVCAYLTSIILRAGRTAGTFISPHLVKINERIMINGAAAEDSEFAASFDEVMSTVERGRGEGLAHPSFFEFLFLMAMASFRRNDVEYAILETGLGGRLDATNVPEDCAVSVITPVSIDHTDILGSTVEEIAAEKAGIIKKGTPVVYYGQDERVRTVIEKRAAHMEAKTVCVKKNDILEMKKCEKDIAFSFNSVYYEYNGMIIPFIAEYQAVNAMLAVDAAEILLYGLEGMRDIICDGIRLTKWEARMEEAGDNIYIDGAHNAHGMEEFLKAASDVIGRGNYDRKLMIYGSMRDKDYKSIIKLIGTCGIFSRIYAIQPESGRALTAYEIKNEFIQYMEESKIVICDNVVSGFAEAAGAKGDNGILFCAGSLYLAGEIKKYMAEWRLV